MVERGWWSSWGCVVTLLLDISEASASYLNFNFLLCKIGIQVCSAFLRAFCVLTWAFSMGKKVNFHAVSLWYLPYFLQFRMWLFQTMQSPGIHNPTKPTFPNHPPCHLHCIYLLINAGTTFCSCFALPCHNQWKVFPEPFWGQDRPALEMCDSSTVTWWQ